MAHKMQSLMVLAGFAVVGAIAGSWMYERGVYSASSSASRDWTKPMAGVSTPFRAFIENLGA